MDFSIFSTKICEKYMSLVLLVQLGTIDIKRNHTSALSFTISESV